MMISGINIKIMRLFCISRLVLREVNDISAQTASDLAELLLCVQSVKG
jgi:hypothetical protein